MKRCPACHSTYTDETLLYCLQDGVPLESPEPKVDEAETVIRQNVPEAVTVEIASEPTTEETKPAALTDSSSAADKKPGTLMAVLATIAAMLVLFGVIGVAGYFYFNRGESGGTGASNSGNGSGNSGAANTSTAPSKKPTDPQTPQKTPTSKPTPAPDFGKIKKDVADTIYNWVSLAEARKLGPYMEMYGDRIDYYNKRGASRTFVRNDKKKAFTKNDSIKIDVSKMSVTPAKDGKSAVAIFDKQFRFTAPSESTNGKVRSRLVLHRSGNHWKIVSERDVKVYYVNK